MYRVFALFVCVLYSSTLQATSLPDAASKPNMTLLLEFSAKNAEAYHLQMQHWQLVQHAVTPMLDIGQVHVSLQRSLELVQQPGYCAINKMKTPDRLAKLLFTDKPINISPSLRLIRLGAPALQPTVDLEKWFTSSRQLKIGIAGGRSYGQSLDQLLQQHPNQVYQLSGEDVHLKLWQMLQKGRLDALIDYSVRIDYLNSMQPSATAYSISQIAGQPPIIEGYLVCSRSEHGQTIVALVNQALEAAELQQALYQSYRQYFPPEEWQTVEPLVRSIYPRAQPTL